MNKQDGSDRRPGLRGAADSGSARAARSMRARRGSRGRVPPRLRGGGPLTREAERLLEALLASDAEALLDPTEEDRVLVRRCRNGVSVGAGRFAMAAADALTRHDLARWSAGSRRAGLLRATEAGRARQRRRSAGEEAPFLNQHTETASTEVATETGTARVRVDLEESPLDWLRRRRGRGGEPMIDEASYQAGERLRADFTLAGLMPGVTARWDLPKSGGPGSPSEATDRMVAARQRVRRAFEAVGSDFADLLTDLCGFLKGLELIERERRWPPRSAKVVVRLALARLAEHYGLDARATGPASRGIRSWRALVIDGGRRG
jgi:hypothetical protein